MAEDDQTESETKKPRTRGARPTDRGGMSAAPAGAQTMAATSSLAQPRQMPWDRGGGQGGPMQGGGHPGFNWGGGGMQGGQPGGIMGGQGQGGMMAGLSNMLGMGAPGGKMPSQEEIQKLAEKMPDASKLPAQFPGLTNLPSKFPGLPGLGGMNPLKKK